MKRIFVIIFMMLYVIGSKSADITSLPKNEQPQTLQQICVAKLCTQGERWNQEYKRGIQKELPVNLAKKLVCKKALSTMNATFCKGSYDIELNSLCQKKTMNYDGYYLSMKPVDNIYLQCVKLGRNDDKWWLMERRDSCVSSAQCIEDARLVDLDPSGQHIAVVYTREPATVEIISLPFSLSFPMIKTKFKVKNLIENSFPKITAITYHQEKANHLYCATKENCYIYLHNLDNNGEIIQTIESPNHTIRSLLFMSSGNLFPASVAVLDVDKKGSAQLHFMKAKNGRLKKSIALGKKAAKDDFLLLQNPTKKDSVVVWESKGIHIIEPSVTDLEKDFLTIAARSVIL